MHNLHLRNLLSALALSALLPLSLTACDDGGGSGSGSGDSSTGGSDSNDSNDAASATVTVTDTTPTTVTDTTPTTGDSDPTTGVDTTDTEATTGDTEATTGDTEATTGDTEATTGDTEETTGVSECATVTIDSRTAPFLDQAGVWVYPATISNVGEDVDDTFRVEFYDLGDGAPSGTIDLAAAPQDNYATCATCVRVLEDFDGDTLARQYFQSEGTLTLSESVDTLTSQVTFAGVRLVEVEIDGSFNSTPVKDGACIDIVDIAVDTVPAEWSCSPAAYDDGATCDCGCGIADPDCADATEGSCDECNAEGSCAAGLADCGAITDDDNAVCDLDGYAQPFEDVMLAPEFTFSGDADWVLSMAQAQAGMQAIANGDIDDDMTSDLSVDLEFAGAGSIFFWTFVSTEEGWDFLDFYIDDVLQDSWSGEIPWTQHSYPVAAGTHTFRWSYAKDGSTSEGSDTVWVDEIATIGGALPM